MEEILSVFSGSNEQLVKIVIAIIAIFVIVSIVRSVYRLIMPVVIVGLVLVVFLGVSPNDVINKGKQFITSGSSFVLENILPFVGPNTGDGKDSGDLDNSPGSVPFSEEDIKNFFKEEENNKTDIFEESESESSINKL